MKRYNMNDIIKLNSSEFVEKYMNVKLFNYQRLLGDSLEKYRYYLPSRGCSKRLTRFLQMYDHLTHMKDNDIVVIVKSDENVKMNKKEFVSWLSGIF